MRWQEFKDGVLYGLILTTAVLVGLSVVAMVVAALVFLYPFVGWWVAPAGLILIAWLANEAVDRLM